MKKILQITAAATIASAGLGGLAYAQTASCTNTGPGSTCTITINDVHEATLTCNNGIYQATYNNQGGSSGDASSGGNTTGGDVATGTVVNVNGADITIGVTGCEVAAETPGGGAITPPEAPAEGGGGAGAFTPASLPFTSDSSMHDVIISSLIAAAGIVVASRLAAVALRRYTEK